MAVYSFPVHPIDGLSGVASFCVLDEGIAFLQFEVADMTIAREAALQVFDNGAFAQFRYENLRVH